MLLVSFVNTEQQKVIGIFFFGGWVWCPGGAVVEDELNVAFQGALSEI